MRRSIVAYTALTLLLAVAGALLFGIVHAIAIVPIWTRLLGGLPFALVAAIVVIGAYDALIRCGRWPSSLIGGFWFGVLAWACDMPATVLVGAMRYVYAPAPRPAWVDPVSFAVSVVTGVAVFGYLARRRAVALWGGVAIGVLIATAGGAVPVVNSSRASALWIGLLIVKALGGALLGWSYARSQVNRGRATPRGPLSLDSESK